LSVKPRIGEVTAMSLQGLPWSKLNNALFLLSQPRANEMDSERPTLWMYF
jgi:hypothetical protein